MTRLTPLQAHSEVCSFLLKTFPLKDMISSKEGT